MTIGDASEMVVGLTRALASTRSERNAWRLIAQLALGRIHAQHVETEHLRARYHATLDDGRALRAEIRRYTASVVRNQRIA